MPQLGRFALSDMVSCSAALRQLGSGADCMEAVAQRVVEYLYDGLADPQTDVRDCVLVRFFKTHPYAALPPESRQFADHVLGEPPAAGTTCLSLLATRGAEPAWNDRTASAGHQAVPLPSEQIVGSFPMIAQLIAQFGLSVSSVLEADPDLIMELDEKTHNVFYVDQALGSPHIPAQAEFVIPFGIASVLGFGGILPSGDLFAVILFARTPIPVETAELFASLALAVKVAVLPFVDGPWFRAELADGATVTPALMPSPPVRTRTSVIEQLLEAQERIAEEQARRLERARAQQHRLADAAVVINSSLSLDEILERVTEQARAIVAAHQSITSMTVDQNWAQAITAVSLSDKYAAWRTYDAPPDGSGIYALVCETNRPIRVTQVELESHPRWRGFGTQGERHPPMRDWLAAPLVSRDGRNLGLIQLSDKLDGEPFSAEDEAILVQLAQMASISIENARLFEREHDIAATLQRNLLPQQLPALPGVEVAARYYPGAAGVDVGGDWYDVFPVADGQLALALGDVAGRGIQAASVMGQLRIALRAHALGEPSPTCVVQRLDRLVQSLGLIDFATLAYGVWEPATQLLHLVLAGHPPPLIIYPDGEVSVPDTIASVPLGAVPDSHFEETRVQLPPGSTVLLYSDGLIETRTLSLDVGLRRLREIVQRAPAAPEALCDHIVDAVLTDDSDDDVTLLAVRLGPRPDEKVPT